MLFDKLGNAIDDLTKKENEEETDEEEEDEEEDNGLSTAVIIGGSALALGTTYFLCRKFGVFGKIKNHFENSLGKTLSEEGKTIVDSAEYEQYLKWKESQKQTEEEPKQIQNKTETTKK